MSGHDCVLACGAKAEPGVQYRAVRWYKVGTRFQASFRIILDCLIRWFELISLSATRIEQKYFIDSRHGK